MAMIRSPFNEKRESKGKVVRDNIHSYIPFTEIERGFLAQQEFHRLHFISQNGLAFHTYPATKHTRFLHSLGAMHVAGQMLLSAMRKDTDRSFADAFSKYLQNHSSFRWLTEASAKKIFADDRIYRDLGIKDDVSLCIMFQAVRIASLIHDIGHPPFSHTVEEALSLVLRANTAAPVNDDATDENEESLVYAVRDLERQLGRSRGALHEQIGAYLVTVMIPQLEAELLAQASTRLVELAIEISANYGSDPVLTGLKGIIEGEFDCDRADYVIRDCAAAGVDFGGYDLARIITEMSIVRSNKAWFFRPTLAALPAIESFYEERSHLYRWIVYHHSCIRSHVALQRTTIGLIRLRERSSVFKPQEVRDLADAVASIRKLWDFANYRTCDEAWYFSFLADFLRKLDDYIREKGELKCSDALLALRTYGHQARWREPHLHSLWKRIDEYRTFCLGVHEGMTNSGLVSHSTSEDVVPLVNSWLHAKLDRPIKESGIRFWEQIEDNLRAKFNRAFVLHLAQPKGVGNDPLTEDDMTQAGVLLVDEHAFKASDKLVTLQRVSPVPLALSAVWDNSIHFRAYAVDWTLVNSEEFSLHDFGVAVAELLTPVETGAMPMTESTSTTTH